MAVPKKRMSRTRKLLRCNQWKLEIRPQALKALSLAKAMEKKTLSITDQSSAPNSDN